MATLDRRSFLRAGSITTGAVLLSPTSVTAPAHAAAGPFRHGVASGDPLPDGVLLWTRVTPTADALPGSGSGPVVDVGWQVSTDRDFTRVVRRGSVSTGPGRDHTVKVDVSGLLPGRWYYYRFLLDGAPSPVGRTRTAPSLTATSSLRMGVVSCSNWQAGYFAAYRHLAARGDIDLVLHLGDYIYEYGADTYGAAGETVRPHRPATEMVSLADYRRRHAQYKTDPDLQRLHAAAPWVVTWDDHETANDAWRAGAENHQPQTEGRWPTRRSRALKAYDEWMPVRLDDRGRLYRRLRWGTLAEISMLDLRTYRSKQVGTNYAAINDPDRTITGDSQMTWLKSGLVSTEAQWKLVGNPVMVTPVVFPPLPDDVTGAINDTVNLFPPDGVPYNVDQWDGYTADREELFAHLNDNGIQGTVFVTGDIHSSWACDLPVDPGTYVPGGLSPTVGVELVGTSVTSDNLDDILGAPPRTASVAVEEGIQASNRHVRYLELDSHGFSVLDLTVKRAWMDWFYLDDRTDRRSGIRYGASWAVPAREQRVERREGPLA